MVLLRWLLALSLLLRLEDARALLVSRVSTPRHASRVSVPRHAPLRVVRLRAADGIAASDDGVTLVDSEALHTCTVRLERYDEAHAVPLPRFRVQPHAVKIDETELRSVTAMLRRTLDRHGVLGAAHTCQLLVVGTRRS